MNPALLPAAWVSAPRAVSTTGAGRSASASAPQTDAGGWVLQRRCSMAPAQLGRCLAALVVATAIVAAGFWIAGVPLISAFAGLELLAVLAAFALHARHAADGEHLWLQGGSVQLERRRGARVDRSSLDLASLRIAVDADAIELRAGAQVLRVGQLVEFRRRQAVANQLRDAVAAARVHAAG